jgi:hypothetical protein
MMQRIPFPAIPPTTKPTASERDRVSLQDRSQTVARKLRQRSAARISAAYINLSTVRWPNACRITLVRAPLFRNHDIRRSCRSTLARLKIPEDVAEAVLAHRRGGIVATYDVWHRLPEKREALERWSHFLADLIHPRPIKTTRAVASGDAMR